MPVKRDGKRGDRRVLVCDRCGTRSEPVTVGTIAAGDLAACEELEPKGWAYDVGFYSMLLGHTVICPDCNRKREG